MQNVIMSIDAGKNSVKVICEGIKAFKFENLVLKGERTKKPSNSNSFEVYFADERYIVGDKVRTLKDYSSNKIIESNKIAIYTAIAKVLDMLKIDNANIRLVTGLPNEHYTSKNEEDLKALLIANEISIKINDIEKKFTIDKDNIFILPENYSVDYESIPRTLLLDLGYRNTNINLIENGDMMQEYMKHSEKGIVTLKNKIAEELEAIYNEHFEIEDITDNIIVNGLPHDADSKEAIKKGIIKHFEELINEIESKGIKMRTVNHIALRGGGTKLIKMEHIREIFPKHSEKDSVTIEGDEYKNADIFQAVGVQYFGDDIDE
ncbi:ParM/StbA family protein [Tepidibacter mesophilus]|uniref:ParM/StbA family protein n=1 Tax=Tepidibacter mesophilus TaxID=655607 RepID=UPI000C0702CA|nr:ParM/StbA family protein [Tepidibacter mesophilus]